MMSVMTIGCERGRVEMTDRSRGCIILVHAGTNASGECAIGAYKANQANSKAACSQSHSPQSGHECVDSEDLVGCISYTLGHKDIWRMRRTRVIMEVPSAPS
jgi:hypothetical protein